jgi:ribokinase
MHVQSDDLGLIVVGSANQDYIVRLTALPRAGETVLAKSLLNQPGGKGANQAVAAARLGASVSFIACVGDDADGALLLRQLRSEGVETTNIEILNRGRTGIALVSVMESGENAITVVPGANLALDADRVAHAIEALAANAAVMVIQGELLPEIIEVAVLTANKHGLRSILNLAPYQALAESVLSICDPLVVNEAEASALVGWDVHNDESTRRALAQMEGLARSVVITVGAGGAHWAGGGERGHASAPKVDAVVDTTGAGDAFVGALGTRLSQGEPLAAAVEFSVRAGSFAVTSPGAQSSYATMSDLLSDTVTGSD